MASTCTACDQSKHAPVTFPLSPLAVPPLPPVLQALKCNGDLHAPLRLLNKEFQLSKLQQSHLVQKRTASQVPGLNYPIFPPQAQGVTARILTYHRVESLFQVTRTLREGESLARIVVAQAQHLL